MDWESLIVALDVYLRQRNTTTTAAAKAKTTKIEAVAIGSAAPTLVATTPHQYTPSGAGVVVD